MTKSSEEMTKIQNLFLVKCCHFSASIYRIRAHLAIEIKNKYCRFFGYKMGKVLPQKSLRSNSNFKQLQLKAKDITKAEKQTN